MRVEFYVAVPHLRCAHEGPPPGLARGRGLHPQFSTPADRPLAARVVGVYQGHVGETRADLDEALVALEREADDFKLVRGFAKLVDREVTFETRATIDPERTRSAVFAAAESVGVVTDADREAALSRAADSLGVSPEAVEHSLYADLDERQVLTGVDVPWDPDELLARYDLSLAQTALFDATEVRIRSSDPRAVVSAVKRFRLMYEIRNTGDRGGTLSEREVVVTGPDSVFRRTRRYGTRFARLLRTVAKTGEWDLTATIDDHGTDRELHLTHEDLQVPGADPVVEVSYDSGVEADFATRFSSLDLDWDLVREPEPLETGARVIMPDFAFEWKYGDFRVYFGIMGFWTPAYVEKKLARIEGLETVELLVAVDDSLGVGEELRSPRRPRNPVHESRAYQGRTRRPPGVRRAAQRRARGGAPRRTRPESAVTTINALAADYGVSESVVEGQAVPRARARRAHARPAGGTRCPRTRNPTRDVALGRRRTSRECRYRRRERPPLETRLSGRVGGAERRHGSRKDLTQRSR